MASLLIQETLGKDTSDQLYTIDHDFKILKNFTYALMRIENERKPKLDWKKIFNKTSNSEYMQTLNKKSHLAKQIL